MKAAVLGKLRLSLAAVVLLSLAACSNALPEADLKGLAEEARMMANHATVDTHVIENLKPEYVDIQPDGVYIKIGGFFVTQFGFFVPHDPAFKPTEGSDPSFTPLGEGVWRYDFAG